MPRYLVVSIALLALASHQAHAGARLDCYTCNSYDNQNCPMVGFDESTYTKSGMNCSQSTEETMASVQRILYPGYFETRISTLSSSKIEEERCVKFTAKSKHGQEPVTFRGCFFNGHYSCEHIKQVMKDAGSELIQCDLCKHKYYCNDSTSLQMSILTVFGAIVLVMTSSKL